MKIDNIVSSNVLACLGKEVIPITINQASQRKVLYIAKHEAGSKAQNVPNDGDFNPFDGNVKSPPIRLEVIFLEFRTKCYRLFLKLLFQSSPCSQPIRLY